MISSGNDDENIQVPPPPPRISEDKWREKRTDNSSNRKKKKRKAEDSKEKGEVTSTSSDLSKPVETSKFMRYLQLNLSFSVNWVLTDCSSYDDADTRKSICVLFLKIEYSAYLM